MLLAGQSVAAVALLTRAGYLQLVKGQSYHLLSEENRLSLRLLPPPRGKLLDHKGQAMATNQQSFRAVILRENVKNVDQTLTRFADVIDLAPEDRTRIQLFSMYVPQDFALEYCTMPVPPVVVQI